MTYNDLAQIILKMTVAERDQEVLIANPDDDTNQNIYSNIEMDTRADGFHVLFAQSYESICKEEQEKQEAAAKAVADAREKLDWSALNARWK